MGLILRVDVDKPYGRGNLFNKIKSKVREDFWFPQIYFLGYLKCTEGFINYCNSNDIQGLFYFRNCTVPNKKILNLLKEGNHQIGFHAEDTRNISTFKKEWNIFNKKLLGSKIHSFTKHGSGEQKLGRHHYPPYEPNKYRDWAKEMNINYYFGNEIADSKNNFSNIDKFFPKMFWINRVYRDPSLSSLEQIVAIAKDYNVPVIIHPSNFYAETNVNQDFKKLVSLAKEASISWTMI